MFTFKVQKTLHSRNRDNKIEKMAVIFPIYLDREIEKSQGILSTHVCGNHGSK